MTTLRSAFLLAFTACTINKGDLGKFSASDTTESAGETDDQTSSTTEPATTTDSSGNPDTTTTDVPGSSTTTTDASTGDTGGVACAEPTLDDEGDFTITFDPPLPFERPFSGIVATCTVLAIDAEGPATVVALDCVDRSATIELQAGGWLAPVAVNDELRLWYHRSMPWWQNEWFTLRAVTEGSPLIAGGQKADALLPFDDDTLFSPVQMAVHEGVCGPPLTCDDPFERLVVEYEFDGDTLELVDGTSGLVGQQISYKALLRSASKYHDMMNCSIVDVSPMWFTGLLLLIPEG